jgi:endonuclease-3 related protein
MKHNILETIYDRLVSTFGPQHWWPGDTPFEVAVGAILTQNTNWQNVEKAINNLKHVSPSSAV